jgi:hypothetical protein
VRAVDTIAASTIPIYLLPQLGFRRTNWFASAQDFAEPLERRQLSGGFRFSWKHSPMRIANPFIMIAHIIGSLGVIDDSAHCVSP